MKCLVGSDLGVYYILLLTCFNFLSIFFITLTHDHEDRAAEHASCESFTDMAPPGPGAVVAPPLLWLLLLLLLLLPTAAALPLPLHLDFTGFGSFSYTSVLAPLVRAECEPLPVLSLLHHVVQQRTGTKCTSLHIRVILLHALTRTVFSVCL